MGHTKNARWEQDGGRNDISQVIVQGFKSLARPEPYCIEIRPLTLLAGANSSGKSSAIQPLLLLKQTLEAPFDPGPLLLNGPHVRFSSTRQVFPAGLGIRSADELGIGVQDAAGAEQTSYFKAAGPKQIVLARTTLDDGAWDRPIELNDSLTDVEIRDLVESDFGRVVVFRRRCFFDLGITTGREIAPVPGYSSSTLEFNIQRIIHLPGLRGNPERSYQTTGVGRFFPGTFETYIASVIHGWQEEGSGELQELCSNLERLGLTWKVQSTQLDATRVELQVGRLPRPRRQTGDLVNIADVGVGVSQVLPVVVALLVAEPGQLVYIEQPEIHLHPKAQIALAELLAGAANRGVHVVAETHSALLVLAVQALVAEQKLAPKHVALHWFQRDKNGVTEINTADLDEQGAYGDWPEDFGEIELAAQSRYMNAAENRLFRAVGG